MPGFCFKSRLVQFWKSCYLNDRHRCFLSVSLAPFPPLSESLAHLYDPGAESVDVFLDLTRRRLVDAALGGLRRPGLLVQDLVRDLPRRRLELVPGCNLARVQVRFEVRLDQLGWSH